MRVFIAEKPEDGGDVAVGDESVSYLALSNDDKFTLDKLMSEQTKKRPAFFKVGRFWFTLILGIE